MKVQLLVTATGEDRPGIVARLTEVFVAHGANLEESRMALLGGEFAAIVLVSLASERLEELLPALDMLKKDGILVTTKKTSLQSPDKFKGYIPYDLSVSGADHEGIVHKVTAYLREHSINIQNMESDIINAPDTGTPLFCMRATVQVPPSVSMSELQKQLQQIGDQESVDITVAASGSASNGREIRTK